MGFAVCSFSPSQASLLEFRLAAMRGRSHELGPDDISIVRALSIREGARSNWMDAMINGFCIGDRVKLTDRYASVLMNEDRGPPRSRGVDWRARRGAVVRLNSNDVYIVWDGRATFDVVPYKAVERDSGATDKTADAA